MALDEFIAKTVAAGEPLTAQAWNEIVTALAAVNQHIRSSEGSTVSVEVADLGIPPGQVRITATPQSGPQLYAAVRSPEGSGREHVFSGLPPGVYTLRAEAPGFETGTKPVEVPVEGTVPFELVPRGALMPALFGLRLDDGLRQLEDLGIAVSRVLDIAGREVAPANPGSEYEGSPVLVQTPEPGTPVLPEERAQLAVAAALEVEPSIEVPSLAGLSLAEAKKALEAAGLVLGTVENRRQKPNE